MDNLYLFAIFNLLVSLAIVVISLCRLNSMQKNVLWRVRLEYSCYVGGAIANGLQPWWQEYPEWGTCALAVAMLIGLLCSARAWKGDRAPDSATDRAPLGNR